ncbi:hypothetical protein [Paenibacillus sp. KS-LC4]|uniref:hypothetical protein n=1 Tax=Paenibacillus sp. KS-LC4 TaxID=2979727 RepID=UPI0030CA69A8
MLKIQFPEKYTLRFFLKVSQLINDVQNQIIESSFVKFDLSRTMFIDPFGMVTLLSFCRHLYNTYNIHSVITLPEGQAGSYMARAGFDSLNDSFITIERPRKNIMNYLKKNENMGVLKFFDSESDIMPINTEFESWMKQNQFTEYEINSLTTFVSEMIQNVCQHSRTRQRGVICIQAYISSKGEPFLSWAIGDSGIGIRQSLLQSELVEVTSLSDERVIREVITKGISRFKDDKTRGNGLTRLYHGAQKRGASLYIQSNSGLYGLDFDKNRQKKLERPIPFSVSGTNIGFFLQGKHLTTN